MEPLAVDWYEPAGLAEEFEGVLDGALFGVAGGGYFEDGEVASLLAMRRSKSWSWFSAMETRRAMACSCRSAAVSREATLSSSGCLHG